MEFPINESYSLIGIADMIYIHDGKFQIIDWKSSKDIKFKSHFDVSKKRTKRMKYPISKLEDANGVHY